MQPFPHHCHAIQSVAEVLTMASVVKMRQLKHHLQPPRGLAQSFSCATKLYDKTTFKLMKCWVVHLQNELQDLVMYTCKIHKH